MKSSLSLLIIAGLAFAMFATAQTSVLYNADLYAVGTVFTNRVVKDALFDPGPAGSGSWDFTSYIDGDTSSFTSLAYDAGIPHIGECAVPPNYTLYYSGTTDTSEVEGWGFSYVDPGYIDGLGLFGTMDIDGGSDYELLTINDTYTHANEFPIDYLDSWTETIEGGGSVKVDLLTINYNFEDTNWYNADGYGTIILPTGTYDALRVKKRHWRHSWSTHWLFGFDKVERRVSYLWFCTDLGTAVTFAGPIDSTGGQPDSTFSTGDLTLQVFNNSLGLAEHFARPELFALSAYPNPFNSAVTIAFNCHSRENGNPDNVTIEIYDVAGRKIETDTEPVELPVGEALVASRHVGSGASKLEGTSPSPTHKIVVWRPAPSLASGVYLVRATIGGETTSRRVVYLK